METPVESLMKTAQASNMLVEEAMRKLVEAMKENAELRKLLVRVKMYVPDSQQELHARIHRATEQ